MVKLWSLGRAHATFEGSSLKTATRKSLALLAYLAVRGGTHHRDMLASLWSEIESQSRKVELLTLVHQDTRAAYQTREAARRRLLDHAPIDRANLDVADLWQVVSDLA